MIPPETGLASFRSQREEGRVSKRIGLTAFSGLPYPSPRHRTFRISAGLARRIAFATYSSLQRLLPV
jgi:hypothetical protein